MGASPTNFQQLFIWGGGGGGGFALTLFYIFILRYPMVILLISDLECHSDLECQTFPIIPYNFTLDIYLMERQDI